MANTKDRFQHPEELAYQNYIETIRMFHDCMGLQPADIPDEAGKCLADRLCDMLKKRDMTQTDLATISGSSRATVSNMCNNSGHSKSINIRRVELYAAILNCTPHYLLGLSSKYDAYTEREIKKDCEGDSDQNTKSFSSDDWELSPPTEEEKLKLMKKANQPTPFLGKEKYLVLFPNALTEIALTDMIREIGREDPAFVGFLLELYGENKLENLKNIMLNSGLLNTTDPKEAYKTAMKYGEQIRRFSNK